MSRFSLRPALVWGLLLASRVASAQADLKLLPPDEAPETSSFLLMYASAILTWWPFLAAVGSAVLLVVLHQARVLRVAREWPSRGTTKVALWLQPALIALGGYVFLCAAVPLYALAVSPDFLTFFVSNILGARHLLVWSIVGLLVSLAPMLFRFVVPATR